METTLMDVASSGEWLPVEDLIEKARAAFAQAGEVQVNLAGVDHLDASALQVLLALAAGQKQQGRATRMTGASASLREWFNYAGAAEYLEESGSAHV